MTYRQSDTIFAPMIVVGKGKLYRSGYEKFGVDIPGLCYQVRNLAGVPVTADYTGPGADHGDRLMIGRQDSCSLSEYAVDNEATQESIDQRDGALCRVEQIRATFPKNASEAFRDGWQDADRQLRAESKEGRAERVRAIKYDRMAAQERNA